MFRNDFITVVVNLIVLKAHGADFTLFKCFCGFDFVKLERVRFGQLVPVQLLHTVEWKWKTVGFD